MHLHHRKYDSFPERTKKKNGRKEVSVERKHKNGDYETHPCKLSGGAVADHKQKPTMTCIYIQPIVFVRG